MERREEDRMGGRKPEGRLGKDVARLCSLANVDEGSYRDFSRFKQRRSRSPVAKSEVVDSSVASSGANRAEGRALHPSRKAPAPRLSGAC